jgi:hypothetical protein
LTENGELALRCKRTARQRDEIPDDDERVNGKTRGGRDGNLIICWTKWEKVVARLWTGFVLYEL